MLSEDKPTRVLWYSRDFPETENTKYDDELGSILFIVTTESPGACFLRGLSRFLRDHFMPGMITYHSIRPYGQERLWAVVLYLYGKSFAQRPVNLVSE